MKKVCIIICSLLLTASLALGFVSTFTVEESAKTLAECDLEHGRVSY